MPGMTHKQRARRYASAHAYGADHENRRLDGQCFRYGAPLAELSELDFLHVRSRAWNLSDLEQLDEINAEGRRRRALAQTEVSP